PENLKSYTDIADNENATISIMSGATENDFVVSEGVDESQIQSAPDIPATIAAVESGRADATTGTEMTLLDALESADSDNLEFVEILEDNGFDGERNYPEDEVTAQMVCDGEEQEVQE